MYKLNNFDAEVFLQTYWQKRPVVIRQAFVDFQDPLDEHELAGLAQEESIDSRIVSRQDQSWQLSQGPFDDFTEQCQGQWSLLVQNVDGYSEDAESLLNAFDFIPAWRTDDLMVSFSVAGAGVGPHLDQYDVFIIQGKGSRHWKVGEDKEYNEHTPHPKLKQVSSFEPIIDEVLHPGDMIYIPPGFPHDGVAKDKCLNYSVGFRAPNQQELLSSFADYALDTTYFQQRYSDPDLALREKSIEIKQHEVTRLREMLLKMINSNHFEEFLGSYLSRSNLCGNEQQIGDMAFEEEEVSLMFGNNQSFYRASGVKSVYVENESNAAAEVSVFVNEIAIGMPKKQLDAVLKLLNQSVWSPKLEITNENSIFFVQLMTKLVNAGLWYPE